MIPDAKQFAEFKRLWAEAKDVALDHDEFLKLVFNAATSDIERQCAELKRALAPFAEFAKRIPDSSPDALCIWPAGSSWGEAAMATALDFRTAQTLVECA